MTPEETFEKTFDKFRHGIFKSSLDSFVDTGKLSGSLMLEVRAFSKSEIDRFKSVLREEVEKRLKKAKEYDTQYAIGSEDAYEVVLQLLDSVTPKK